ncbi:hypothetical protein R1sor_020438 [Riccia sorocarpa]|uniref:DUF7869 domain-containing protein n=1 Tax=Riccia sorocarpa TaxID=122646 RepID=A0ABD3IJN4_9MARC
MASASKHHVSKKLDLADVARNGCRQSVLGRRKSPDLEDLFDEHHYDSEKGHYTQVRKGEGTIWSDSDNKEETTSSETRGSRDLEDRDKISEEDMSDVSSPLMRRMSSPEAEDFSPRQRRRYTSSPNGLSKDAHPMRRMGGPNGGARGQPMRRMGCHEEAELRSNEGSGGLTAFVDSLLDLSPPTHAFLTLPSNKSYDVPALQKNRGVRRQKSGFVTSPAKRTKNTSPVTVARLQARFRPLRDELLCQELPSSSNVSPRRKVTTEVLELSSDDFVRKVTLPTKSVAKDLRVDVPDDDISWLEQTPLPQNKTSASSPLPLLDLSPITMMDDGSLFQHPASALPVRPRRLSFSPSSDSSEDFFKELSGSHKGSTLAQVSSRWDDIELNTNSQGGTTLCSGDLSTTQPQQGPRTEVRRYRETLREEKQSRQKSTPGSCKVNSKERQKQFFRKHLGTFSLKQVSRKLCCAQICLRNLTVTAIQEERHFSFRLSRDERSLFLDSRYSGGRWNRKYVLRSGVAVCPKAFITIFCVGESKLVRIQNTPSYYPTTRDVFVKDRTAEGFMFQEWLDKFFLTHCERQSNSQAYHLPNNLSKSEMKHNRDSEPPGTKKDEAILGLRLYRQQQRATGGRRRNKALSCPEEAAYIAIDGMDQNKTRLPHFTKVTKLVDGASLVGVHLVGVIIYHHTFCTKMFSRFSVALRGKKAFTMPQMQQVIQDAYVPSPKFEVLEETWDFKSVVQSRPSPVLPLHDVTFNQQFKIALGGDNWPRLWTKKFSTDKTWEPTGGVRHLVMIPDVISDITAVPLVAFKSHSHKREKIGDLSADALESFAKIKKDIQNVCFSFFSEAERNWWHNWFMRQEIVSGDTQSGRQIRVMRQWRWRSPQDKDISRSKQPPTLITSRDLEQRILGERRPAYASTRRACPVIAEHDRMNYIGDIKDLASGHMVAVMAEDDKSFWISKVLNIKSRTIDGEPNEVEIQWNQLPNQLIRIWENITLRRRETADGAERLCFDKLSFYRIFAFLPLILVLQQHLGCERPQYLKFTLSCLG